MRKEILNPFITMATEIKSISVSRELAILAEQHKIGWSEAARTGMAMLLADRGVQQYDNKLNLKRKLDNMVAEVQRLTEKANETR